MPRPITRPGSRPIIIDTDPGIDDAVAILLALASPEVDVLGLVAVAGNLPVPATTRNALSIVELARRPEVPIYAGCPRPIGGDQTDAEHAHGVGGLGDLVLPPPVLSARPEHGVFYLIDTLRAAEPRSITVCALGPLTNIAMALVASPEIAAGIAELVIMGGALRGQGNVTPAAEFNIHADPHAAAIVFDSGVPITMVPLDVTRGVRSTPERIAPIRAMATRCGAAVANLLGPRRVLAQPPMAMHDPCVIAYLLAPELFQGRGAAKVPLVNVAVETQSPLTLGATVVDRRGISGRKPNARVIETVDADGVYRLLAERCARLP
jgi:purine nucleosidase